MSSLNRELQVLRRLLHLAFEWGFIELVPKVKMLNGEEHREFVLSGEEEAKYLTAAREPWLRLRRCWRIRACDPRNATG